jgi:uncharacterized repeat protein (TIGR03803 family)
MVILSEPRYLLIRPAAARASFASGLLSSLVVFGLVACGGGSSSLSTARFAVLYSFGSNSSDGATPVAGLIQVSDDNLYGTTSIGGANGGGTVFSVSPSTGTETVLYSFAGDRTDGGDPRAELLQGSDGNLYGVTWEGGTYGNGAVFTFSPINGVETVLYSFMGGSTDGANPSGRLIQGSNGELYGMTTYGGANDDGTVFELSASGGVETVLHSFAGGTSDGKLPAGGLVQGSDGKLYGTTTYGGANNAGTVFVLPSQ